MACEQVKGFLSQAGVEITVRDVDADPSAYDELLARGWRTVPVTIIGDRSVRGFDRAALQEALTVAKKVEP
jgi:glutaredoxin